MAAGLVGRLVSTIPVREQGRGCESKDEGPILLRRDDEPGMVPLPGPKKVPSGWPRRWIEDGVGGGGRQGAGNGWSGKLRTSRGQGKQVLHDSTRPVRRAVGLGSAGQGDFWFTFGAGTSDWAVVRVAEADQGLTGCPSASGIDTGTAREVGARRS